MGMGGIVLTCDEFSGHNATQETTGFANSRPASCLGKLPLVELEIVRGRAKQKLRTIQVPVFLIGAAGDCDLVLGAPLFPDVHTYVYVTEQGVSVRHLGVAPFLYVNGKKVESSPLHHGDRIQLGDAFEFRVKIPSQLEQPDAPQHRVLRFDRAEQPMQHMGVSNRQVLLSPH